MRISVFWGVTAAIATAIVLTGCASTRGVGPHSQARDPAGLDAGAAIAAAAHDAHWPDAAWWHAYGDPQLDTLIATAQSGNPTLAAAQARVRSAQALAAEAHADTLPQLNGSLSLEREHWSDNPLYYGPGTLANTNTWNNTGALSLSYHLDLWGKDRNGEERALDNAHAAVADERTAQLELTANVVRVYIDFAQNEALLDIAHEALDHQQQLADLASKRLRAGLGTQLEVSQAQAPVPEYARQIHAFEETIALDRNQLAVLLGQGPGAGDKLTRPTLALTAPAAALPSALPAELLGRRPDVVAARWRVEAQTRGIDVAKAAFYPDINLLGMLGGFAVGNSFSSFLQAASGAYTVGPAFTLPIFDGGRLRAQLGAASAGYDLAVAQYDQTLLGALQQISDGVVKLRSLAVQRDDAAQSVALAQRAFSLAHMGFQRGLTDYVSVLVAENQLLVAEQGAARISAARLAAHAALMTALGGGIETAHDDIGMAPAPAATVEHAFTPVAPANTATR